MDKAHLVGRILKDSSSLCFYLQDLHVSWLSGLVKLKVLKCTVIPCNACNVLHYLSMQLNATNPNAVNANPNVEKQCNRILCNDLHWFFSVLSCIAFPVCDSDYPHPYTLYSARRKHFSDHNFWHRWKYLFPSPLLSKLPCRRKFCSKLRY